MNERIKEIRKINNLNQTEFGDRIGATRDTIANIEGGRIEIKDIFIKAICREFKVNESWLRSGEGDMYNPPDDEDIAILSDMLDNPSNIVVQALLHTYKLYNLLDDTNKKIIEDEIRKFYIDQTRKDQE